MLFANILFIIMNYSFIDPESEQGDNIGETNSHNTMIKEATAMLIYNVLFYYYSKIT